jgi:hypothetical protein
VCDEPAGRYLHGVLEVPVQSVPEVAGRCRREVGLRRCRREVGVAGEKSDYEKSDYAAEIRAAVEQRFAQVARSPEQERKFPVGPASAKKFGYDPPEINALPSSVT